MRAYFLEKFGKDTTNNKQDIYDFKQKANESLADAWVRFKKLSYNIEHGLKDWMLINSFYSGLRDECILLLEKEAHAPFVDIKATEACSLLDGILIETNIFKIIYEYNAQKFCAKKRKVEDNRKTVVNKEPLKENKIGSSVNPLENPIPTTSNEKQVEEIKMLSEVHDPLINLEKCSLHELFEVLQKFASDPTYNVHQVGFGSYVANHVLKEKLARYNHEAMIPHKLGDAWLPKILITIGKITHHAILDLGSSVSALSKEFHELLELTNMENCTIELALADHSTKQSLGIVKNVMVELHMTFVPVDFVIMDMDKNTSSHIILGRPFLRTSGAVIDCKEGNVKFHIPHKKSMEHFPRKKELCGYDIPHAFRIT